MSKDKRDRRVWRKQYYQTVTKTRHEQNPELRKAKFLSYYGISLDEFKKLEESQGGVCAICKQKEMSPRIKYLSVDHDHTTGKVRGLLCSNCNNGLGRFKDSADLLRAAVDYIIKPEIARYQDI